MRKLKVVVVVLCLILVVSAVAFKYCYKSDGSVVVDTESYSTIVDAGSMYNLLRSDIVKELDEYGLTENNLNLDSMLYFDEGNSKELDIPVGDRGYIFVYLEETDMNVRISYTQGEM